MHHIRTLICTISLIALTKPALATEARELQISRLGDTELACGELSQEALLMRDIISTTQDIKSSSKWKSRGIGVAGAVGSLLIGTATGGIGIAAAGYILDYTTNEKSEDAESVQNTAQQRRALMMGIYNAKGCEGPLEHALQDGTHEKDIIDKMIPNLAAIEPAAGENAGDHGYYAAKPRYNE